MNAERNLSEIADVNYPIICFLRPAPSTKTGLVPFILGLQTMGCAGSMGVDKEQEKMILTEIEARKAAETLLEKVKRENQELQQKVKSYEHRVRELENRPPDPRLPV